MKSIFDPVVRSEILQRIDSLNSNSKPLWGKMSVAQMVRHCSLCEDYYLGNTYADRSFLGRIIGQMALKRMLKNEAAAMGKNAPTAAVFRVTENIDGLDIEKQRWKSLIEKYAFFNQDKFMHWFFGPMTKAQLGQFIYKHCNHHLQQFGA